MPHKEPVSDDDWRRMGIVLSTIRPAEILPGNLSEEDLLRRLFAEDTVRVFEHQPLAFTAQGNRKRMLDALASLGVEECRDILDESDGTITMTDEYSGAEETFTEGDIAEIFGETWIPRVKH
jgi:molecular chaperone Hsp33